MFKYFVNNKNNNNNNNFITCLRLKNTTGLQLKYGQLYYK